MPSLSLDLSLSGWHHAFGGISIDAFLAAQGLTGSNAGADFNAGRYWLPSLYDSAKPVECREDDWFANFTRASEATGTNADGSLRTYAANKPTFNWSGGKRWLGNNDASTNLAIYSLDTISDVWYGGSAFNRIAGQLDPYGTNYAAKFTATGSSAHYLAPSTVTYVNGTVYTLSIYIKPDTQNLIQLTGSSALFGASQYANFQLTGDGIIGSYSGCTPKIEKSAFGYYRLSITATAIASASANALAVAWISSLTDSRVPSNSLATSFFACCCQTEQKPFATPYIPTSGSAVTRAADKCCLPAAMEGVIKQQNSSVICRYFEKFNPNPPPIPERQHILFINDSGYGRYAIRRINFTDPVPMAVIGSSVANADMRPSTPVTSANTPVGVALAVGSSGASYSVNGSLTTTATVWDYASNLTKSIYVGRSDTPVTILPLQMGLIAAFPTKLSDAQLQSLSGNLSWI